MAPTQMPETRPTDRLMVNTTGSGRRLDTTCACLSTLCLINCLATPLLFASLSFLASWMPEEATIHRGILALTAPLAAVAFYIGWRRHRRMIPLTLGLPGLALLWYAGMAPLEPRLAEIGVTLLGASLIVTAHLTNMQMRRGHVTS